MNIDIELGEFEIKYLKWFKDQKKQPQLNDYHPIVLHLGYLGILGTTHLDEDGKVTNKTTIYATGISDTLINTVSWQIKKEVNYALEGSIFIGGAAIQWLRDNLKIIEKAADSEAIAAALNDNEDVYFVPALQGLGAPYWEPQARGTITGLTRKSNRNNIIRAALEAMAYQVCDVLNEMKKATPEPCQRLRVDGGAAVNNFLMQFQADLARLPVERATITETTALGAAGVAAMATGFWDEKGFAGIIKRDRVFQPLLDEQKALAFYQGWQTAVTRCRQR